MAVASVPASSTQSIARPRRADPALRRAFAGWSATLGGSALQAWIAAGEASKTSENQKLMNKEFRGWLSEHPEVDDHGHTAGEMKVAEYIYLHHGGPRETTMTRCDMTADELKSIFAEDTARS